MEGKDASLLCHNSNRIKKISLNALLEGQKVYLIDIMNELVHLPEPRIRILITKIGPHSPHDMIGPCHISLREGAIY